MILSFIDNKIAKIVVLLFTGNEISCGGGGLWGGEMNSEAVSVGDTASLLGCTCRWVAPMCCPALFGRWAVRGVQRINAGGTETKT